MRKLLLTTTWVVVLSVMLSACQSLYRVPRDTCDHLLATSLQPYIGQEIAADTFAEAVEKAYSVPFQEVHINKHEDGSWFINWNQHGLGYGALSENGTYLDRIGVEFESRQISVEQLLDCIPSMPEWYWAAYGSNPQTSGIRYAFSLYFPAQGIVATATGTSRTPETLPSLNTRISISRVFVGAPGSFPALYKQRWGDSLEEVRPALRPLPWPKAWESIEFIEDNEPDW